MPLFSALPEAPSAKRANRCSVFFELIGDVMIRMTNMVMMYAPIGVFGLISYTVSQHGLKVLLPLGKLILVSAIASVLHVIICYSPLVKYVVRIPLGNTINMDGTAIYMGVAAVFAAEVYGIPLTLSDQLTVMLMGLLASIGTAGVPGAGLIMVSLVFTQISIPLEALALIAGIDRVLDMIRTSINVLGDATGALLVSKLEGDLNTEPFAENEDVSELNTGTETFE
ncbi:dicarboxylate/amino acid:cation symporter [Bilophila wadsworthia]|uniref:dicarboxylate/amino acid:cation symporter n=1 Tax=Bilophila wadsworthia TaxID=35833 RepID=UPI00242EE406|nr:cation:dicarboxylase symporter family transporter [Bilophila wadsworthia]